MSKLFKFLVRIHVFVMALLFAMIIIIFVSAKFDKHEMTYEEYVKWEQNNPYRDYPVPEPVMPQPLPGSPTID